MIIVDILYVCRCSGIVEQSGIRRTVHSSQNVLCG